MSAPAARTASSSVADLLAAAQAGDGAAWNELVIQLSGLPWAVARAHRLPQATAEDVVQTTWLRLLENLDRIRDADRLPGWLATTARRESLRVLRVAGRTTLLGDMNGQELPDDRQPPVDERLLLAERDTQLWHAFAQLPPTCQALLRLLLADPAPSYIDVAAALGRPVGAIGPTRGRCLHRLREVLQDVSQRGDECGSGPHATERGRS